MPSLTTKRNSRWLWNSWQRGKLCGGVRRGAAREDMWKRSQFWSAYYFILENRSEIIVLVSCSVAKLCLILCNPMDCSMPGFPVPLSPRVCSDSCPLSQWCHPTISSRCPLLFLPSIFPSIRVFSNELALHIRWPKYPRLFATNFSRWKLHSWLRFFNNHN